MVSIDSSFSVMRLAYCELVIFDLVSWMIVDLSMRNAADLLHPEYFSPILYYIY